MRAVIVDDMELARESLRADLAQYCPELELVGEAQGVVSAAKLLREIEVDLIFLDINMGDGVGFDLLDILPNYKTKVIFVTASDEHALKAFQYAAIDYLLKPVDPELLKQAVAKIESTHFFSKDNQNVLKEGERNNLVLSTSEELRVVEISQIIRCQSMGNYTQFYFNDGTKMLITKTLKDYDSLLSEKGFIRVHQSHLVNREEIKAFVKTEGGYLQLKDGSNIPVSVRKKPEVMKIVSQIK